MANLEQAREKSCLFCAMLAGHQASVSIYKDSEFMVIMDKYPISAGHLLVIPQKHYDNFVAMPPDGVCRMYRLVQIIAKAVVHATHADGFNVGQNNGRAANQIVPHVHVHVIPRFEGDSPDGKWPSRRVSTHEDLDKLAFKIRERLGVVPAKHQNLNY